MANSQPTFKAFQLCYQQGQVLNFSVAILSLFYLLQTKKKPRHSLSCGVLIDVGNVRKWWRRDLK